MKYISLLIPEGNCSLSNLEAIYKMFTMANDFLIQQGKTALFEIDLVALEMGGQSSNSIFTTSPTKTIQQIEKTDLIIIPAIHGNYKEIIQANKRFAPWIIKCYKEGTEVASLCIGAFLLASTGLLNGKNEVMYETGYSDAKSFRDVFKKSTGLSPIRYREIHS